MTTPQQPPRYQDPNDFLMGGGYKSATFKGEPPISWEGEVIEEPSLVQKRDYDSGDLLFWPDGNPRMQMVVVVQTDVRDPQIPDDDGIRAHYLDGSKARAVRDAVRAAGADRIDVGGRLTLTYTHDGHNAKGPKFNPPKQFSAVWAPPNPLNAVTAQPAAQEAAHSAAPDPNVAKLVNAGLDALKVAQMAPDARAMLAAQLGL